MKNVIKNIIEILVDVIVYFGILSVITVFTGVAKIDITPETATLIAIIAMATFAELFQFSRK